MYKETDPSNATLLAPPTASDLAYCNMSHGMWCSLVLFPAHKVYPLLAGKAHYNYVQIVKSFQEPVLAQIFLAPATSSLPQQLQYLSI